jgi:superfamily II DNA or RNA helicase
MIISTGDIYSFVNEPRRHTVALATIRQVCRARPEGYRYMPGYKAHRWDGYVSLMKGFANFPTGLLDDVCKALIEANINYELASNNRVEYKSISKNDLCGITLRDYQYDAIQTLGLSGRGVAKMATNSGKTEVMAGLIMGYGFPKTVVLLHRKELLYQTQERFQQRLGRKVGIIGDGVLEPDDITICMIQTLSKKWEGLGYIFLDNVLLMVDECHTISSNQMMDIVFQMPGHYRFGFSGTPLKYDVLSDLKLVAATGPIRVDIGNQVLIEEGYSAKPVVTIHEIPKETKALYKLDYASAVDGLLVHHNYRNCIVEGIVTKASGVVLILVNRLEHGELLSKSISGSIFVTGSDTTAYRQMVLNSMRGENGIFIATPIFDEGIDVPAVSTLILVGGGESHIKLLQRIGRGLRRKEGDNTLYIHDFMDLHNKYLKRHSLARLEVYRGEGFDVSLGNGK